MKIFLSHNMMPLKTSHSEPNHYNPQFKFNSFCVGPGHYVILQNTSDYPVKFRLASFLENCVSSYKADSTTDLKYDTNNDNLINLLDLAFLASKYNSTNLNSNFYIKCDLNNDGICDIYDIVMLSSIMNY